MAATSVRMKVQGAWRDLTWNPSENAWEVEIIPVGPSTSEPGGTYLTTVEIDTDTGETLTYDGTTVPGLNLKVEPYHFELIIQTKRMRRVVDTPTVMVYVMARGVYTAMESVTIAGIRAEMTEPENNIYSAEIPLEIGRNDIVITARDIDGATTSKTVRVMRMITDRIAVDSYMVATTPRKPLAQWTAEDHATWREYLLYGCYDDIAMNRVCDAVRVMLEVLMEFGYWADVAPKPEWLVSDAPTTTDYYLRRYLSDVDNIQKSMPEILNPRIELPEKLEVLDWVSANDVEKALVNTDANLKALLWDIYNSREINAAEP